MTTSVRSQDCIFIYYFGNVMIGLFWYSCFPSQVRKYRTMTEVIFDAIEYVKNPYKGKKLKVRLQKFEI